MTAAQISERTAGGSITLYALKAAAALWFLVALAGQWVFVAFIAGFYGPPTLTGNFEAWDKNVFLIHGYIAGDPAGNFAFAAHVMMVVAGVEAAVGLQPIEPTLGADFRQYYEMY